MLSRRLIFSSFVIFSLINPLLMRAEDLRENLPQERSNCYSAFENLQLGQIFPGRQLESHFAVMAQKIFTNSQAGKTSKVVDLIVEYNQQFGTKYSPLAIADFWHRVLNPLNSRLRKFYQGQNPLKFYPGNQAVYWDFLVTSATPVPFSHYYGPMDLNVSYRALIFQGEHLALNRSEFELLSLVREEGGKVISIHRLLTKLPWETDAYNLHALLAKLKKKVTQKWRHFPWYDFPLEKVYLVGYRWRLSPSALVEIPQQLGNLVLYPQAQRLFWQGKELELSSSMIQIILMLINRQYFISDQRIIGELNNFVSLYSQEIEYQLPNFRKMISRLRQEFLKIDPHFDCLQRVKELGGGGWYWRCR